MASVDALELFKNELDKLCDVRDKKITVSKMVHVAKAIGATKVKSDLLPYLSEYISKCDEDELLAELAKEIGNLLPLVDSKVDLLPSLAKLCKADETKVREEAVPALARVGNSMDDEEINEAFFPLVKELVNDPWWACKVSGAGLIAAAYTQSNPDAQAELRQIIGQLTKDETPMVRRSLARNYGDFFLKLQPEVAPEILPHFKKLQSDDQDSVRIFLLSSCISACKSPHEGQTDLFIGAIENFSKDASWRVRLEVTKLLSEIAESTQGIEAMPLLKAMLEDVEVDVRRLALDHVPKILSKNADAAESSGILEAISKLVGLDMETPRAETALQLKTTLAKVCVELGFLGKPIMKAHILPMIVKLLEEEVQEVRIAVVETLPELVRVVGADALSEKVSMRNLAVDEAWRVRMSFLQTVPLIAASLKAANDKAQFDSTILPSIKEIFYGDADGKKEAYVAVRKAGAKTLADLHTVFGDDFSNSTVKDLLKSVAEDTNYLYRITATQIICCLCDAGCQSLTSTMADVAMQLCTDKVINVRFNAAQACGALAKLDKSLIGELKPFLTKMLEDDDPDCVAFAKTALASC